ncbi:MAG TPA: ScaI family restriction endonuclease [Candidatus Brocadiia bacterium]|nr:ScaI family restriction endonuclease [Candidatus Brocadiales bacterium]
MQKTQALIRAHPLNTDEAVEIVLKVWDEIMTSAIGSKPFKIGIDLLPKPQIMAFFLHELIPLELATRHPKIWRGDKSADEKDLVYIPDQSFSVEIKTSSHPTQIFGNRSFAQKPATAKKSKSGYCLAINFEKFSPTNTNPKITRIRFGWLDHEDWTGQKAPTGQQARLSADVEKYKLLQLYSCE